MSPAAGCPCCGRPRWREVWRHLQDDITRFLNKSPENQAFGDNARRRLGALLTPQLSCLLLYRLSHALWLRGWGRCAGALMRLNRLLHRIHLSADSCIGPGCLLPHPMGVFFVGAAGPGLTLYSMAIATPQSPAPTSRACDGPRVGARVTLGVQSVLLGPVVVGDDARVGPRVKVAADVPAASLVMPRQWRGKRVARRIGPHHGMRGAPPPGAAPE